MCAIVQGIDAAPGRIAQLSAGDFVRVASVPQHKVQQCDRFDCLSASLTEGNCKGRKRLAKAIKSRHKQGN